MSTELLAIGELLLFALLFPLACYVLVVSLLQVGK